MHRLIAQSGRLSYLCAVVVILSGFASLEALFAPKAELWERWAANDPNSTIVVNHDAWNRFLQLYVKADNSGLNQVDYARVSKADSQVLHTYLQALRKVPVSHLKRTEQRAYWINLYNALTVRLIIDYYPVKSIQDIDLDTGLFSSGPWGKKLIRVEGELLSLNDIEHRILRPIWKDPRLHYAVNCASVGCPDLQSRAFNATNTEVMLDSAAAAYINSSRGAMMIDGALVASKIYLWFQDDFGGSDSAVLAHLKKYANAGLTRDLSTVTEIADYAYDWTLNATQ